jgi:hypothetical protein
MLKRIGGVDGTRGLPRRAWEALKAERDRRHGPITISSASAAARISVSDDGLDHRS